MIHRNAFTLIELLIAMTIMMVLMSMMMAVYGVLRAAMLERSTDNVLRKTDTCLRMFRNEWGVYPFQATYPSPVSGTSFPNNLYYRIGTDISWSGTPSDAAKVKADIATAAGKFNDAAPTAVTYRTTDVTGGAYYSGRLNTCARERVRLAVISGNLGLCGPLITDTAGVVVTDRRSSPVLSAAEKTSLANPGWACDYIRGDLEPKYIQGNAILDAWKHPLIYLNQTVPAVKTGIDQITYDNVRYGLGLLGFDPSGGPSAGVVAAGRAQLLSFGRIRLSLSDAGDGRPTPADPAYFPDASNLMHSDRRYYAGPGHQDQFELWSAGRDGRFDYLRDDQGNRDNRAVVAYDREIR